MKKIKQSLIGLFLICCGYYTANAQNITPEKKVYGAAEDLYFSINHAKKNDTLHLINEIKGGVSRIVIKDDATDILTLAGNFKFPGLYRFKATFSQGGVLSDNVYYFFVYSGRELQRPSPPAKMSLLPFVLNAASQEIADTLVKLNNALRVAYKTIATDTSIIRSTTPPDTIHYNRDTLQLKLDSIAGIYSKNIDSGFVIESSLIINFPECITVIVHPKATLLSSTRLYVDSLLTSFTALLKKDSLLADDDAANKQIEFWLNASDTSHDRDHLTYFKRRDDFMTRELMKSQPRKFNDKKSQFWIGYDKGFPDRLYILFRLVGSRPKKTTVF